MAMMSVLLLRLQLGKLARQLDLSVLVSAKGVMGKRPF